MNYYLKIVEIKLISIKEPTRMDNNISQFDMATLYLCYSGSGKVSIDKLPYDFSVYSCYFTNSSDTIFIPEGDNFNILMAKIKGDTIPSYFDDFASNSPISFSKNSQIYELFNSVYYNHYEDFRNRMSLEEIKRADIKLSALIHNIFSEYILFLSDNNEEVPSYPSYIDKIKKLYDEDYSTQYSLSDLEEMFKISKYKICHEFTQYIGISPVQYLLNKRIDASCHLLKNSKLKIHEVGAMVGIENTNHFINLFKKKIGCTPLEYRQTTKL